MSGLPKVRRQLMFYSIVLKVKKERYENYSEAFNFFQSKSINMIIGSRKLDYVVHYRDLEFLDDETEYFKRYYSSAETATRLRKLINYYEINMTPPTPNLLPIHNYHILETRNRKLLKLCILREKSLARKNSHEKEDSSEGNMILSQINQSNLSAVTSEKEEDSDAESYDSQPHNAYDHSDNESSPISPKNNNDVLTFRELTDSFLVIQFKNPRQQPPAINVLPPIKPPPQIQTVSVAIQTLPVETSPLPKKVQTVRPAGASGMPPELKKQVVNTPLSQGLGMRSEIKSEHIMLTESMEVKQKEEKKKANTFMEYYNSIPVKSPSNILERYIKRKK